MNQVIRMSLIPLALIVFVIGLITGKWLVFGTIGVVLLIFTSLFYSGRKQRVRYWIQGYKTQLENNGGDEKTAIEALQKEFCSNKYADEDICNHEYQEIGALVEDIIKREFKFEQLVQSPISSPDDIQKNLHSYIKAVEMVKKEITDVKKEVL